MLHNPVPTFSFPASSAIAPVNPGDSNMRKLGLVKKYQVHDDSKDASSPPNSRPRPLTPPLPENKDFKPQVPLSRRRWRLLLPKRREKQSTQYTLQQTQSALFECLPTEIRLLIWEHYLCSRMLHIVRPIQRKWKRPKKTDYRGFVQRTCQFLSMQSSLSAICEGLPYA
jgi:hypothetical protein